MTDAPPTAPCPPGSAGEPILLLGTASSSTLVAQLQAMLAERHRFSITVRSPPGPEADWYPGLRSKHWAMILLVVAPEQQEGTARALGLLPRYFPSTPVVVVAEEGTMPAQLAAWLDLGAADFLIPPFRPSDVLARLWHLAGRHREEAEAASHLKAKVGLGQIIGQSEIFMAQVKNIPMVARFSSSVLIQGETGTGKELIARSIHHLSTRASQPFIPVSCAGIPEALAENELFGHAKGAYTGASQQQRGLVAEADGGTLLLDDVDCLTPAIQAKLLRFLQDKEYRLLGSTRLCRADVRIIASSNLDLSHAAAGGRFRLDLYHRLNVVPIYLPPLRERLEDIPPLARHFLARRADELGIAPPGLPAQVMDLLLAYDWPGNVRELEHVIERAVILSPGDSLDPAALMLPTGTTGHARSSLKEAKAQLIARFERSYLERQLQVYDGNVSRAARASGKQRRAFFELVRKHNIDVSRFRG